MNRGLFSWNRGLGEKKLQDFLWKVAGPSVQIPPASSSGGFFFFVLASCSNTCQYGFCTCQKKPYCFCFYYYYFFWDPFLHNFPASTAHYFLIYLRIYLKFYLFNVRFWGFFGFFLHFFMNLYECAFALDLGCVSQMMKSDFYKYKNVL